MGTWRQLSIRARLTLFFELAITILLTFTGFALINLVHHSLETQANNQIQEAMVQTQEHFGTYEHGLGRVALPLQGDVVIQITNLTGTQVWAASSAIGDAPVLARQISDPTSSNGTAVQLIHTSGTAEFLPQLNYGQVGTILTKRGPGLIFGFVFGGSINHNMNVLLLSLVASFPIILLLAGGLTWIGIGLALAPVESIRRRVDAIAAQDLTQRVPQTGGHDEVARMARTVNAMLDRLEAASQFQQEFVSNASHELRSPLTTLLATTERALADPERANWPEIAEVVTREGRRLDGIIDGLFWLARHDEHGVETQRVDVDLDDLLFEEAQRVRSLSELTVDTSAVRPTRVVGDPAMLKRMIRNVVDNAVRYSNSALALTSFYDDDMAVVQVSDDGEGLDVDQSARLFERFARADSARSRLLGGTGLGLSIVAEIVNRHGGSAQFLEVANGTTIELRVRRE